MALSRLTLLSGENPFIFQTSLSKLEHDIEGITPKMLLEYLNELIKYGFVDKKTYSGYPLYVEYFLTEKMGKRKN